VGRILDRLDDLGLRQTTIVLFTSDHGEWLGEHLNYGKGYPGHDCVSRVPMIVRWPGKTVPGSVCDVPSDIADIYPTIMDMAGVDYSDFKNDETTDGESLVPLLSDLDNKERHYTRDEFYQFYGKMGYQGFHKFATWATLRKGDYKLHYDYHGKVELYNIAEDMFEKNDLVAAKPGLAHDMLVQLTQWLAANCSAAYLPSPNPRFDPNGNLPYGPYIPLEELKASLLENSKENTP